MSPGRRKISARESRARGERGGRTWSLAGAAVAVLAAMVVIGALLVGLSFLRGGDDGPAAGSPTKDPSSALPSSAIPTARESGTSASPTPSRASRAELESFARDYLAQVTADPTQGWLMLTPRFRSASGGFSSYGRFWNGITQASPGSITGDAAAQQVSYAVTYQHTDGTVSRDQVTLRLRYDDGTLRIDGEK